MSLKERTYSILVVSSTDSFALPLSALFLKSGIILFLRLQVSAQRNEC